MVTRERTHAIQFRDGVEVSAVEELDEFLKNKKIMPSEIISVQQSGVYSPADGGILAMILLVYVSLDEEAGD